MKNKLSSEREYFKHGKLLYEIYEKLFQEDKISVKGQEDIRFKAFGHIYYSLVENPWKSIGITIDLLKELQSNNFKRIKPDGKKILMTRSHIYDRAEFFKSLFLDKTAKKTIDQLLSFLWHKDITIMSLKEENKSIQEILKKRVVVAIYFLIKAISIFFQHRILVLNIQKKFKRNYLIFGSIKIKS